MLPSVDGVAREQHSDDAYPRRGTHTDADLSFTPATPMNGDRDGETVRHVLEATRNLLWVRSPSDAQRVAEQFVRELGAEVVPASPPHRDAIPVDLTFGSGDPMVPVAPPDSHARHALQRHLGQFVRDAVRAIEMVARAERLREDASVDLLTGLPNRRLLDRSLRRLARDEVVIMIDLDHFKRINDELGHLAGDHVLRTFGRVLRDCTRSRDVVGRYGGEEFIVIMTPVEGAPLFLERLRDAWLLERPQTISFSAGVARSSGDGAETIHRADAALYLAKRTGRDRWIAADDHIASDTYRTVAP